MFSTTVYYSEDQQASIPTDGLIASVNDCYRAKSLIREEDNNNHGVIFKED